MSVPNRPKCLEFHKFYFIFIFTPLILNLDSFLMVSDDVYDRVFYRYMKVKMFG